RSALVALKEAVAVGEPFPLGLLDSQMPELDGFGLARRIRQEAALADCLLVMLTSAGHPKDVARCRELGISAYLTKPIKESDLLAALLTALGCAPIRAEPAGRAGANCRSLRVLLAEDNLVNQYVAVELLKRQGHSVVVAGNGREALQALGLAEQAAPAS